MASGAWIVCSACGLHHSARPDGLCPRCHAEAFSPPDAPGAAIRSPAPALAPSGARRRDRRGWGLGRIAAIGLIVAGLAALVLGIASVAPTLKRKLEMGDRVQGNPMSILAGRGFTLTLPPDRWYAVRRLRFEITDTVNELDEGPRPVLVHRLLRAPEAAHLVVISWKVPGDGTLDLDAAAVRVSDGTSRRLAKWKLLGVSPLPGRGGTRVLHATAWLEEQDVELLWGLFPDGPTVWGVLVAAEPRTFTRLRGEMEGILSSFRFEAPSPAPPPAAAPRPTSVPAPTIVPRRPLRVRPMPGPTPEFPPPG
jgi:hypothetical protein